MRKLQQFLMGNTGYQVQPNILFWIKLKILSRDNHINKILQIAYVYTDLKLTQCQSGSHIVIQCNKEDFDLIDNNQLKFFKDNGLYEACIQSKTAISEAQELILKDIEFRKIARGQLLAAGKQIHLAKYALMHHMPKLYDFLHYRIFDLTSVELVVEGLMKSSQQSETSKPEIEKRANEEVWQDIHQMQFYYQHALNDF